MEKTIVGTIKYIDSKKNNILFWALILPTFLSLVMCVVFVVKVYKIEEEFEKVKNSDLFLFETSKIFKSILDSDAGIRGFMITGDEQFLEPWSASLVNLNPLFLNIKKLIKNNPDELQVFQKIELLYKEWQRNMQINVELKLDTKKTGDAHEIELKKNTLDEIRLVFNALTFREEKIRLERLNRISGIFKKDIFDFVFIVISFGIVQGVILVALLKYFSSQYESALSYLTSVSERWRKLLIAKNGELKIVKKELDELNDSLIYDLRAPLRGIDGIGQIIMKDNSDKLDGEAIRYLNFLHHGVMKMEMFFDELINLSQITRSEFKTEEVNLSQIAADIMMDLSKGATERKVEFKNFDCFFVIADYKLIKIALKHLLTNAWKCSSIRNVTKIELGKKRDNGRDIYFVKDNGIGFDTQIYDKLFKPFQKIHPKEKFLGTGISLAKVSRIIHRHGGEVWAESRINEDTIFYFTLNALTDFRKSDN